MIKEVLYQDILDPGSFTNIRKREIKNNHSASEKGVGEVHGMINMSNSNVVFCTKTWLV